MAKEILLYNGIYSYTAESFIKQLDENKGNDICVRMNCPGGDVMASMGMIAKYNEHAGAKSVKVDGRAASMAAFMCCMADNVECLDVSEFLIHRAAFPSWVENDKSIFTDDMKAMLVRHNATLRSSLENKVDASAFKKMTGKSLDDVFSMDSRIDVTLSAKQAEKLGLVSKITPLNRAKKREINALASNVGVAAFYTEAEEIIETPANSEVMTIAEVKANTEVYAAIKAEVLAAEKDRITALAEYKSIDPAAVLDAVVSGEIPTLTFIAKMHVKQMSAQGLANVAAASASTVATTETATEQTEEQKAEASIKAEMEDISKGLVGRFGGVTA